MAAMRIWRNSVGDAWAAAQNGFTVVALGWQWDGRPVPTRFRLYAPVAKDHGKTITGLLRGRTIMLPAKADEISASAT